MVSAASSSTSQQPAACIEGGGATPINSSHLTADNQLRSQIKFLVARYANFNSPGLGSPSSTCWWMLSARISFSLLLEDPNDSNLEVRE